MKDTATTVMHAAMAALHRRRADLLAELADLDRQIVRSDFPTVEAPGASGVYFLLADRFVKIGMSTDIRKRVRGLQLSIPTPGDLVHVILTDEPMRLERELHERFRADRTHGEWFRLSPEIVDFLYAQRDRSDEDHARTR